jgi:hypothetical protein
VNAVALAASCVLAACSAGGTPSGSSVDVAIEPDLVTVVAGTSQTFVAAVTGTANPAVTWSVEEGSVGGEISPPGVYQASNGRARIIARHESRRFLRPRPRDRDRGFPQPISV